MESKIVVVALLTALLTLAACSSVADDVSRLQDVGVKYCAAKNMAYKGLYEAKGEVYSICNTNSPYKEYSFQVT